MQTETRPLQERKKSISAKAVYLKAANRKLVDTSTRLAGVRAKIKCAVAGGQIEATDQLAQAQRAIEINLKAAEMRIELLRKTSDKRWQNMATSVETAWAKLSRSIENLAGRFPDESN